MMMKTSAMRFLLLLTLTLLVRVPCSAAPNLLFTAKTINAGSNPQSVASADINGDGKLDLISANQGNNTLTVLTNNGGGTYGFKSTLAVGNSPQFVLATDVNNDGKPDLICANAGSFGNGFSGTLTVLTNNGTGTFGSNATLAVGSYAICVALADVNGDTKPDLISANNSDNTLTVLTNNGSGQFGFAATLTVGNSPNFVASADVNGDGKMDLISADQVDGTLTILTNGGAAGFIYNATLSVGSGAGSSPYCVAAADVNSDGKTDLISADEAEGTLTVLTNNGAGVFSLQATLPVGGGSDSNPYFVAAADLNGDGKMDLISANSADNTLTVLTNGNGGFGLNTNVPVGNYPTSIVVADLNGDGKLDLASANNSANTLSVLFQLAAPKLSIQSIAAGNATQLVLSWSSAFTNFVVQTNASVTGQGWQTAGYPIITTSGTNLSATITLPSSEKLFFRLLFP